MAMKIMPELINWKKMANYNQKLSQHLVLKKKKVLVLIIVNFIEFIIKKVLDRMMNKIMFVFTMNKEYVMIRKMMAYLIEFILIFINPLIIMKCF